MNNVITINWRRPSRVAGAALSVADYGTSAQRRPDVTLPVPTSVSRAKGVAIALISQCASECRDPPI